MKEKKPSKETYTKRHLEEEFKESFLDYSMSVIVSRALPDVRDGLKPVHRRILAAMNDLGLHHNHGFRKSAKVTGEVTGNYHPHGTQAVYQSLARLAQDFSLRYPLVIGQGNFGSIDGDPPAAERYTEVKLSAVADDILRDLKKNTVPFVPNYDGTLSEPAVLPSLIPNLLVNGSTGIAVGMTTEVPPHNMREILNGLEYLIQNPDCTSVDLMSIIHGPDFPTGGIINGREAIYRYFTTGRGKLRVRARTEIEAPEGERSRIIISEIPYMVNKAKLIKHMAKLVNSKHITGISDIRDESDREGIRIIIEVKRHEIPNTILYRLFKHTQLETTFGVIMLALVDMVPRLLNMKQALHLFLAHRRDVVTRRTQFDLDKAEKKAHILEGLKIAVLNIDAVIKIIKASRTVKDADSSLQQHFALTPVQAKAILEMRLQRLTGLEMDKILSDLKDTLAEIARLRAILQSREKIDNIIIQEFQSLKDAYGDDRRTSILDSQDAICSEDLVKEEEVAVFLTNKGYVKRTSLCLYKSQGRAGTGRKGLLTRDDDFVEKMYVANTLDYFLVTTNTGKLYWLKAYQVPEGGMHAGGRAIINLIDIEPTEVIKTVVPVREFSADRYLVFATRRGVVKKTRLSAFSHPSSRGIIAIHLAEGDALIASRISSGEDEIMLITRKGKSIRFSEKDIRPMGRNTRGVRGIRLRPGDEVVGMALVSRISGILTVTERGRGKKTKAKRHRLQKRGGLGIKHMILDEKTGCIVGAHAVGRDDELILCTHAGKVIRVQASEISYTSRNAHGVIVQQLDASDRVVSFVVLESEL